MNEILELKRALLLERRERARVMFELANLQLKVLEEEQSKEQQSGD